MAIFLENGFATSSEGGDNFILEDILATGAVHWVDSVTGNNSYPGTEAQPLATLTQAITNATANNGDIIIIKSGHTETLTSAVTISKAGLKIFGIGSGSAAPRFTVNAAIDGITVTANNVELNNLYFPVSTLTGVTARVNVDAANVRIKGCTFLCGQYDLSSVTITANGLYAKIESCTFTVSADGPDYGVIVESASAVGLYIRDCAFNGGSYNWDLAGIYSAFAHLNYHYQTITLTGDAGITHTAAAKGWMSELIASDGSQVQA